MEPKSKMGQCPRCLAREEDKTEKRLYLCKLCGIWYCEKHVKPKPCYIVDFSKPDKDPTKLHYINDDNLGHPDARYIDSQQVTRVNQPPNPLESPNLPEPPIDLEKHERTFGTCPKCKCTDSDVIKDYPNKAILSCWNCHLKYGQRKYSPYHYIRLRKHTPHSRPREPTTQIATDREAPCIAAPQTGYRKTRGSIKKTAIALAIIISFLAIIVFSGALSNLGFEGFSLPSPPIVITGQVNAVPSESTSGEGVPDVEVHLVDSQGNEVMTDKTNATGYFSFTNLSKTTYNISITLPNGYIASSATSYSVSYSHDLDFKIQSLLTNPKTMNYHYTLRGVSSELSFTVYEGMYDYLTSIEDSSVYYSGQEPSQEEIDRIVTFRYINESVEQGELHSLAEAIEQITSNEDDQARIAISLVQHIPYSDTSDQFDWKYPYEILYSNAGVCSDKSRLLVCLLRELGYGCSLLEYTSENHEAVGLTCASQYAYYSGYAFVETTSPSIITDWQGDYIGVGKLPASPSYVITIQDGKAMDSIDEEYQDNQLFQSLINMGPVLDEFHYSQWQTLVNKYGIPVS